MHKTLRGGESPFLGTRCNPRAGARFDPPPAFRKRGPAKRLVARCRGVLV